jgi:hypothetical protein
MERSSMSERIRESAELQKLRAGLERQGYAVVVEPRPDEMPFDLDQYRPDMLATAPDGQSGYVVEFKKSADSISVDRLSTIAALVGGYKGWRFILVTPDDINVPRDGVSLPEWKSIVERFPVLAKLIELPDLDPAILYLYAIFEVAMRRLAFERGLPVERLPATRVRNSLYDAGYLDGEQLELCKKFLSMRNKVAHGFGAPRDEKLFRLFFEMAERLVSKWSMSQ